MNFILAEYLPLAIFLIVALVISCLFILANFLVAKRNPDPEKSDAFESGFPQFGDSRMKFDIRFYLVTLLFIIFDREDVVILPAVKDEQAKEIFYYLIIVGFSFYCFPDLPSNT